MRLIVACIVACTLTSVSLPAVTAGEPGWSPVIIATGNYRKEIESLPIEQRPYRPLHVYGNTVRRMHYRGTPLPVPRGFAATSRPSGRSR